MSSGKGKAATNLRQQQLTFVTPETRPAFQTPLTQPQLTLQSSLMFPSPAQAGQHLRPTAATVPPGQYIVSNAMPRPYPMSTAPLSTPIAPQDAQLSSINPGVGDNVFFHPESLRATLESTLKGHQEQTTANLGRICQVVDRMSGAMENERIHTRAVLDALVGKVDQTQDLHLTIAKSTRDRVERLKKFLGVPDTSEREVFGGQTTSAWERLDAVENNLVEILERLKDPEAPVVHPGSTRVTCEVGVSPIPELVEMAGPFSASTRGEGRSNGLTSVPVHYMHPSGSMATNFYDHFGPLKGPTIYQSSLFPDTYGAPSPRQEPLSAAEWEADSQFDHADQDNGGGASTSSAAPTIEPSAPSNGALLTGYTSSRDSSMVRGVLLPTSQDSLAGMFSLDRLSPLTVSSCDDEESVPTSNVQLKAGGTEPRPRRRSTIRPSVPPFLSAPSVNKKRKARASDIGPRGSKKVKRASGQAKGRIKGKAGDTTGLAMAASQYCDWPKKVVGDVRQFAQCDKCDLWYHCICAGLTPDDPRMEETGVFVCPPCETFPDRKDVETSMQGRENVCSRPDCDYTTGLSDTNEYFINRIIGRKPDPNAPGMFCWLVLWDGYDIALSEWVDTASMGGNPAPIKEFEDAARREGLDLDTKKTTLLAEARETKLFS